MDVLFFMRHPGHLRNFESTLRELARRGHRVHLAFDGEKEGLSGQRALAASLGELEGITFGPAPAPAMAEEWTLVAWQLRAMLDYLRYLEPPLDRAVRPRLRAAHALPEPLLRALDAAGGARDLVRRSLGALERAVPPRARCFATSRRAIPILWWSRRCSTSARRSWTTCARRSGSGSRPASASRAGTT